VTSWYSRLGRPSRLGSIGALGVAAALILPTAGADASPKPSAATTQKKLTKLNSQVDKLVNQYDKTKTQLDAAKKQVKGLNSQVAAEQRVYQGLHARVAQIVAAAYKNGTLDSTTALLAAKNPDAALDQMSAFTQLTNNRSQELKAFLDSTQRLRRDQAQAQSALDAVAHRAAALKKQTATVQKAVDKQKALLRQIGQSANPGSSGSGGTYNGPASGPARVALQYAYAQLGKPYIWGGTGPRGYDCSGLTMMSWRAAGVDIPRIVPDQYNATHHVAKANLQPGDLVYFDSMGHEGIYVGGGQFIHAPHTGSVVKLDSMSNPYWVSHYDGASRP
jgi:cell wall-associated NlpC family hydrolase